MYDQALPREYIWAMFGWIALFVALLLVAKQYGAAFPEGSPARLALALAPLLVAMFGVRLDMGLFRKLDEMQRLIMLESLVIACYATLLV